MRRGIFTFIIVIIMATAAVYWVRNRGGSVPGKATDAGHSKEIKELEQKVLAFRIDGRTSKGVKQWHLEGKSAEIIEDEIHFNDLKAIAYGDDVTVNLTSDTGIYNKDEGEVVLIGNVRVISGDGAVMTTDRAKWSQNTREISSDAIVRIERDNMVAVGRGAAANSPEKTATLMKDVRVTIEPGTKVNCDGPLVVSHDDNIATFSNNVKVKDKDGRLWADKLTVHFDPETQKMAEVIAEGNVKVLRGKSYTISDKAVYAESTKSAKLTGNPRVIIDPEELEALEGMGLGDH